MNGWDVRPTLDRANANRRPLAQAAGSFVAGSPLPQALIQCRQRLTYELRLGKPVIPLSWSAPQPVADDSAVAYSPRRSLHRPRPRPRTDRGLAATPHSEPDLTPRTSLRAEQRACAPLFPRDLIPPTSSGSAFPIKNGSEFPIGINHRGRTPLALSQFGCRHQAVASGEGSAHNLTPLVPTDGGVGREAGEQWPGGRWNTHVDRVPRSA